MPVQYRLIQSDFSGGEIDPLAMLNLNSGLRSIGVRESINFLHLQSGAISKRNSSEIAYRLSDNYGGKAAAVLSMQLPDRNLSIIFMADEASTYMIYDGETAPRILHAESDGLTAIHKGSHFAVYQNHIVEVNSRMKPMLYEIAVSGDDISVTVTRPEKWEYSSYPSSCAFAQGRLFLAFRNTVIASRTPDGDEPRFFDFTLADYEYEYILESDKLEGKVVSGSLKEDHYGLLYFRGENRLTESSLEPLDYAGAKALPGCYREVYTMAVYGETKSETILEVNSKGERIVQEYSRKEYTITRNFTEGIADTESIICKTYVTKKDGVSVNLITTESVSSFPDSEYYFSSKGTYGAGNTPVKVSFRYQNESPLVYSDHAIENTESDMYGSQIQWIANLGRIIVATNNSLFISTSDTISPETFDLTPTAYIGSSSLQPKILSNMLIWAGLDRKKLYAAVYSYEAQGLQTMELTASAYHLFRNGISQFEVADTPQLSIYVMTDDGNLRICSLIQTANGTMSPWGTWTFPLPVDYVYVFRTAYGNTLYISEGTDCVRIKDRAIYDYGEDSTGLIMDHIQELDAGLSSEIAIPGASVYENADEIGIIIHDLTDSSITDYVSRRAKVADGKLQVRRTSKQKDHLLHVTIGITYSSSISMFTPVLPSNSGSSLMSYHSVSRIDISLYKSLGGEVHTQSNGKLYIKQLVFGNSRYTDSFLDDNGKPLSFTGVYGIDNPTTTTREDNITIVSKDPYPFNVMAVAQTIRITEVN